MYCLDSLCCLLRQHSPQPDSDTQLSTSRTPCGPHLYCSIHIIHTVAPAQKTSCLVSVGHWIRFDVRMEIVQCASRGLRKIHLGARESNPRPFTASVLNLKCFFHMSRDRPPAGCGFILHVHAVRGVHLLMSQLTLSCCGMSCGKFKKNIKDGGGMFDGRRSPERRFFPEPWPWMQMGGRDLRQEGDSRERRRGNDSGTWRRKTSGSASWHFW